MPCGETPPPVHQAESLRSIAAYILSGLGGIESIIYRRVYHEVMTGKKTVE
jgi:hypothetical protein